MSSYELIRATTENESTIVLYGRNEHEKRRFELNGFTPYFYLPDGHGEFQAVTGERVKKVECDDPSEVPFLRGDKHYEADIFFERRALLDYGISCGFTDQLEPIEYQCDPTVLFIDIECFSSGKMPVPGKDPVTAISVSMQEKYWSWLYIAQDSLQSDLAASQHHLGRNRPDFEGLRAIHGILEDNSVSYSSSSTGQWTVWAFRDERVMLRHFVSWLREQDPDVITGWNVEFDLDYMRERCKALYIGFNIQSSCTFDLLKGYRRLYRRPSYKLKNIVIDEKLTKTLEEQVDYGKLWQQDKDGLLCRNLRHTYWVNELDKRFGIVAFHWALKRSTGLEELDDTLFASNLIDIMLLRRKGKYILPSKHQGTDGSYIGAFVLDPPKGIHEGIAVYDMTRFYPSLVISYNISPDAAFENPGIVPRLCMEFIEYRKKYDVVLKSLQPNTETYKQMKQKRDVVKFLLNAVYGYLAYPKSRIYSKELAEKVTLSGRKCLMYLMDRAKEDGYESIYCDTDSVMCKVSKDKVKALEQRFKGHLRAYAKQEGIKVDELDIKFEKYFESIAFTGRKKRYCGLITLEGDRQTDYIHVTGFQLVRSDASVFARNLQRKLLDIMLRQGQEQAIAFVREQEQLIYKASLMDIAVPKTLSKDGAYYEKSTMSFVKSAMALGLDPKAGDTFYYVYAFNYPYGVCVFRDESELREQPTINWKRTVESNIKQKVEDILELVGYDWKMAQGQLALL